MNTTVRSSVIGLAAAVSLVLVPAGALAAPAGAGCEGLYEVARFETFRNGDTPGHEQVHALLETHECGHHH